MKRRPSPKRDPRPYQKASGHWYVLFYDGRRTPPRKWTATGIKTRRQQHPPKAVQRLLVEWAEAWRRGEFDPWLDAAPRDLTVEEAATRYLQASRQKAESEQTIKAKRTTLRAFTESLTPALPLDALTGVDVKNFLRNPRTGARTRQVYWNRIRAFLNWCMAQNYVRHNVCDAVARPTVKGSSTERTMLLPSDLERVHEAIRHDATEHPARIQRLRLIDTTIIAAATGLRLNELLSRRWADLDLEHRTIRVDDAPDGSFTVKTEAARRVVPCFPVAWHALMRKRSALPEHPDPHEQIFSMYFDDASRKFSYYARMAGLRGVVFHSLRHTAITYWIVVGMKLPDVMKLAGHEKYETTLAYTHMAEEYLQEAVTMTVRRHLPGYRHADQGGTPTRDRIVLAWLLDKAVDELERADSGPMAH